MVKILKQQLLLITGSYLPEVMGCGNQELN